MSVSLVCDDVIAWADKAPPMHSMALLCDPPYELNFMGHDWDRSGIAFHPATWQALARHLLPGAFVMAFASSRGSHRLACALEDAGLILHPIIGWITGQGWPKATKIDTQVDAAAGAEREVIGKAADFARDGYTRKTDGTHVRPTQQVAGGDRWSQPITVPTTPLAQTWAGHRYGLQMLKPSLEVIVVAQMPYAGSPVECITRTGAGTLWIEGSRVAGEKAGGSGQQPFSSHGIRQDNGHAAFNARHGTFDRAAGPRTLRSRTCQPVCLWGRARYAVAMTANRVLRTTKAAACLVHALQARVTSPPMARKPSPPGNVHRPALSPPLTRRWGSG